MKIITFVCLTFVVLSIGCFDGDRGVLTELLPDAARPVQVREPLTAEIAVGTGSELVVSPVPTEIEDALWGSWDMTLDYLERLLNRPEHLPDPPPVWREFIEFSSPFAFYCEIEHRRQFYDKYIDADGIAILAPSERTSSAGVDDEYLFATREIILTMTSKRPGLRQVMSPENGFRYVLVGKSFVQEVNMPRELRRLGEFMGLQLAGLAFGGVDWDETDQVAFLRSDIVVHEWAHAIDYAFDQHPHLFPDWGTRLTAAYTLAYQKALQGKGFFADPSQYALKNEREYWAVAATMWFVWINGDNVLNDWEQEKVMGRDPLLSAFMAGDPLLYALLDEVFPVADVPPFIRIAAE